MFFPSHRPTQIRKVIVVLYKILVTGFTRSNVFFQDFFFLSNSSPWEKQVITYLSNVYAAHLMVWGDTERLTIYIHLITLLPSFLTSFLFIWPPWKATCLLQKTEVTSPQLPFLLSWLKQLGKSLPNSVILSCSYAQVVLYSISLHPSSPFLDLDIYSQSGDVMLEQWFSTF